MKNNKVSVILPTYNRGDLIARSIKSVLSQTYNNIELIVVDDASKDNTAEIVKNIQDERIRYIQLEKNGGACNARNKGIEVATGEYIAFLDSDDCWEKKALEKLITKLEDEKVDYVFCKFSYLDSKGKQSVIPETTISNNSIYKVLLRNNIITNGAIVLHRYCLDNERFDVRLKRFQDWDLFLRIAKKYRGVFLDEVLLNVFYQTSSITSKAGRKVVRNAFMIIFDKNRDEISKDKELLGKYAWRIGVRTIYSKNPDLKSLECAVKYRDNKLMTYSIYILAKYRILYFVGKFILRIEDEN